MRRGLLGLALLAALAGGCAYDVRREAESPAPGRLARLRRVAVAPFRYENDWTGYFRDIYRRAGAAPPPERKAERIEATFLLEDALAGRGYELVEWPGGEPAPGGEGAAALKDLPALLRGAGAEAALLARGGSRCESLDLCTAWVELRLVEAAGGRVVWRAEGSAATLFAQGDEMRAAVQGALSALPGPPEGR